MATLDNYIQAELNVSALLVSITANPKPSYSVDGKSYSWGEYFDTLTAQAAKLRDLIVLAQGPDETIITGGT